MQLKGSSSSREAGHRPSKSPEALHSPLRLERNEAMRTRGVLTRNGVQAPLSSDLLSALVSCDSHNKCHQTRWLKRTEIYYLIILKAEIKMSFWGFREECFLVSSKFGWLSAFLGFLGLSPHHSYLCLHRHNFFLCVFLLLFCLSPLLCASLTRSLVIRFGAHPVNLEWFLHLKILHIIAATKTPFSKIT